MYINYLNFDIHFTYVYQFFCKLIHILHVYINIRSLNSSYLGYLSYNMKFSCLKGNYLTNEKILREIGKLQKKGNQNSKIVSEELINFFSTIKFKEIRK